jgi:signal transduction histidine kinase
MEASRVQPLSHLLLVRAPLPTLLWRLLAAVLLAVGGLLATRLLGPSLGGHYFLLPLGAAVLAALLGGRAAGLTCVAVSAVGFALFFFEPLGSLAVHGRAHALRLLVYVVVGGFFSWLGATLHTSLVATERARQEAERARAYEAHSRQALQQLTAELEERVARRTAELEAANEELEAFSYSVSHDLRAPLRGIDGFLRLVEEGTPELPERSHRYLERARAASRRMAQLIDDLLQLARLSRLPLHRERVDVSALARGVVGELQAHEPERAVQLSVREGMVAVADGRLLKIALENLLGNAWKFSGRTPGASLEVGCQQQEGRTVFHVRDNGAGFDMAYAQHLFAPFQRLHEATDFPGSGIGLATVQRIVRRHGGDIWAQSVPGAGATFFFTLGDTPDGSQPAR